MKVSDIIRVAEIEEQFPKPANYEEIKSDDADRGIQESVVVNDKNQLLCGYTRLAIAEELCIEEIPHRTVDITEPEAMVEYAILDNIRRRQLTDLQLVEYGMKLEEIYGSRQGERTDLGTVCPEVGKGRTRDMVAARIQEKTGAKMSGRKYDRLKTIARQAIAEVKQAFNSGDISQEYALVLSQMFEKDQKVLLEVEMMLSTARPEIRLINKRLNELELSTNQEEFLRGCAEIAKKCSEMWEVLTEVKLRCERSAGETMEELRESKQRIMGVI